MAFVDIYSIEAGWLGIQIDAFLILKGALNIARVSAFAPKVCISSQVSRGPQTVPVGK